MDFIRNHKLILATVIIQIIALPLILLVVKQRQNSQTQATKASTLYFTPQTTTSTPLSKNINEDVVVDLMIDPGANLISLAKLDITYDPSKLSITNSSQVVVNTAAFPVVAEGTPGPGGTLGPILSSGKIQIILSVGADQTKVIQTPTKVLTLTFKAVAPISSTQIGFGTANSLLSIAPSDSSNENVLSTTVPAFIKINSAPTSTPIPNTPTPTNTPSPTPTNTPSPTPTKTPTPTPSPSPSPSPSPTPIPTKAPSSTPIPTIANTILNFTNVKLHGLGKGGDTANQNSAGTLNLIRTTRPLTVEIYDANEILINTTTGNLAYNGSTQGTFDGQVVLPTSIINGAYIVKIKTPYYLRKQIPGFIVPTLGQVNNAASVSLVAGDVDSDNKLETGDDYNLIMECYSDLLPAKSTCDANKKIAADISDDGKVNQDDYNLFLRELSVQQGE